MAWSETIGSSIILPADKTAGDGRNYMVLGEDVPPEVAGRIAAGLVFRTGYDTVQASGDAKDVWYWVFGIDITGAFVVAAYYAVQQLAAGTYLYNRYTMFRLDRDPASGALTIVLGSDDWGDNVNAPATTFNGVASFPNGITTNSFIPSYAGGVVNLDTAAIFYVVQNWGPYGNATFGPLELYKDAAGIVHIEGLVSNKVAIAANVSFATIGTLPVGFRPRKIIILDTTANGAYARVDFMTTGDIRLQLNPALAIGSYVDVTGSFLSGDLV